MFRGEKSGQKYYEVKKGLKNVMSQKIGAKNDMSHKMRAKNITS